jgi:hypothetical protein
VVTSGSVRHGQEVAREQQVVGYEPTRLGYRCDAVCLEQAELIGIDAAAFRRIETSRPEQRFSLGCWDDGLDDAFLPPPLERPVIPFDALLNGDVLFDASAENYVTSSKQPDISKWGSEFYLAEEDETDETSAEPLDLPKDRVREILGKPPGSRDEADVELLVGEMQRLPYFATQPESVRRKLSEALNFLEFAKFGDVIIDKDFTTPFWWVVLSGQVGIVSAEGAAVDVLREGATFGLGCAVPALKQAVVAHRCVDNGARTAKWRMSGQTHTSWPSLRPKRIPARPVMLTATSCSSLRRTQPATPLSFEAT